MSEPRLNRRPVRCFFRTPSHVVALHTSREFDAAKALRVGLAEIVGRYQFDGQDGATHEFKAAYDIDADTNQPLVLPAAVVRDYEMAQYGALVTRKPVAASGYELHCRDMNVVLELQVKASSEPARTALVSLVETILMPEPGRGVVTVVLPHYFNLVGQYALRDAITVNDPARGIWQSNLRIAATGTNAKLAGLGQLVTVVQETEVTQAQTPWVLVRPRVLPHLDTNFDRGAL